MTNTEKIREYFQKIRNAIRSKLPDINNLSIDSIAKNIEKIENGLDITNSYIEHKYNSIYNGKLKAGDFIKIANSYQYTEEEMDSNIKLYSNCVSNDKQICSLYTDIDNNLYFYYDRKTYLLDEANNYIELKQVTKKDDNIVILYNKDNYYYKTLIEKNNISIIDKQEGKILGIKNNNLIIQNNEIIKIDKYLLSDIIDFYYDEKNDNIYYITDTNDLYYNGMLIKGNLKNGKIKLAKKERNTEDIYHIYYETDNVLHELIINQNHENNILRDNILQVDLNNTYHYEVYDLEEKIGIIYQDYMDDSIHFITYNGEIYNDSLLASNIITYTLLYQDMDKLIILFNNKKIIFNLQKGTLNIAKVTKPEDYIAGICISNYELMSGNQVRILCPKEEK